MESDSSKPRKYQCKKHDSSGKRKITQTIETTSTNIRKTGGIFEGTARDAGKSGRYLCFPGNNQDRKLDVKEFYDVELTSGMIHFKKGQLMGFHSAVHQAN